MKDSLPNVVRTQIFNQPLLTVNEEGEIVDLELPEGSRLKLTVSTEEVKMTFKNYVAFDAAIEEIVQSILKPMDYMRYRRMSCWLRAPFNIVTAGNNWPHSLQSLAKALNISVDETTRMLRRLEKKGLLIWDACEGSDYPGEVFMLNPFVNRKCKTVNKRLLTLFPDFKGIEKPANAPKKKSSKSKTTITAQ
jgi:hypothetical protein